MKIEIHANPVTEIHEEEEEDPGDALVAKALRGLDEILREWDTRMLGKPNKPGQPKRGDKQ